MGVALCLRVVKEFIVDMWEEHNSKLYGEVNALNSPILTLWLGMLLGLLGVTVSVGA